MDFHDYIINYPLQNDSAIVKKTTLREEFYELRGESKEDTPEQGKFFKHQQIFARYLRQYDKLFNIHETGTGKTGSIIHAAEMFKRAKTGLKRVVILHPGELTLEDFRGQIIKFFPEYIVKDSNGQYNQKATNKNINKWYELNTYEKFANEIRRISTSDQLIGKYSDSMFFLDEAHKLRTYQVTEEDDTRQYRPLWILLHLIKRSKIVIATATPLINNPSDFVPLFNLLLPTNRQLLADEKVHISPKQLEPIFRGKISYVRALDTGIKIFHRGTVIDYMHELKPNKDIIRFVGKKIIGSSGAMVKIEESEGEIIQPPNDEKNIQPIPSHTPIKLLELKGKQLEVYRNHESNDAFSMNESYIGIFVFPNGEYGITGFDNHIIKTNTGFKFKNKDTEQYIKSNLGNCSAKFEFFVTQELSKSKLQAPGNAFCYLENVKGSGVNLLGIILQMYGFEEFTRQISLFKNGEFMANSIPRKKRFVIITSDTPSDLRATALQLFNSDENIDGAYIQMIIASKAARDGINLANVKRGYIMSPGWHEAGMYQAQSRFIRATSHEALKRRDNEPPEVNIYRLSN